MQTSGGNFRKKLKTLFIITSGGSAAFVSICLYKGNEKFYKNLMLPALHCLFEPERAHDLALTAAKWKLVPHYSIGDSSMLKTTLWGLHFNNPVGLAAGFDKDGEAIAGMFKSGFGFIEVGSVTPLPQPGNPKPRIFRLREDLAVVNRCGFNSKGHDFVKNQIKRQKKSGIIGINLGKNKFSDSADKDYVLGVKQLGPLADYLVINVSSPNTPGLRLLQQRAMLETLIDKVLEARDSLPGCHPLLIKIAPDLSMEEKKDIARVLLRKGKKIDGLIVSNTTISRPEILSSPEKVEIGGLSGKPLHSLSTESISDMFQLTGGQIPIIGVGGVMSGKEAYEKVCAGASLIQIYTALIYEGPPVVGKILRELEQLLKADGYSNIEEAVGADHKKNKR